MGIRATKRDVKAVGSGGRGKVCEDHGSRGPGTKMKWEDKRSGNDSNSSVNALNPARQDLQLVSLFLGWYAKAYWYTSSIHLHPPILSDRNFRRI